MQKFKDPTPFAEPLEGAAQVKTAALVSWLTLPHFREWRQRERNTSPEVRGQWVHPHSWGTFLSVTVREEIQGIQVPSTGANIKVRWFSTHGRSLMLHKGNSVIAQMKTGWLQLLKNLTSYWFDHLLLALEEIKFKSLSHYPSKWQSHWSSPQKNEWKKKYFLWTGLKCTSRH